MQRCTLDRGHDALRDALARDRIFTLTARGGLDALQLDQPAARVLFVDQTSALGGAELSLLDIVKQRGARDRVLLFQGGDLEQLLLKQGADTVVVRQASDEGIQVRKDSGIWGALGAGKFLRQHVSAVLSAAQGCDLIYANTPKAFIVSALAALRCRKPVIYHLRDIVSPDHFSFFNRQALVRLAGLCRATVIANSYATARAFVKAGGRERAVSVIYNGIATDEIDRVLEQRENIRETIRQELKTLVNPNAKIVGVFGRLAEWKGQDVAIRALTHVPEVHMILVGSALFGEDDYVKNINNLVERLGLQSRVHFLGFRRDVAELMQASDVVVHCSSSPEPFGRVIAEAMLSKRPIIAARAGGAVEIIQEARTGYLFTPGDSEHLAACIAKTLDQDQQAIVESAFRDARQRFNVAKQVGEVSELVQRVSERSSSKHPLPVRPAGTDPTRVLFVDQTAQLGGAELCLFDMLQVRQQTQPKEPGDRVFLMQHGPFEAALRQQEIDVSVESLGTSGKLLHKDSGPLRKLLGSADVLRLARRVSASARDMDVICANTPKALVVAAAAGWMCRKRVVYHLHDILSREHFSRSNIWLLVGLANRCVAHVIANSHATLEAFHKVGGKVPGTVIYNGFDAKLFEFDVSQKATLHATLCQRLNCPVETLLLGAFGRLAPWKGQHIAIAALHQLPQHHLVLVGDALFGEDSYKRELLSLADDPKVKGRVHFLGFQNNVAELMQSVDVVVHSSIAPEPFGRVIVEAMLSRTPVVASRAGGVIEILEHGQSGWLAAPGDASSLAQCIKKWFEDDNRSQAMVEAAYERALRMFELGVVVRDVEAVMRGVKGL